jgi:hypothetical protein
MSQKAETPQKIDESSRHVTRLWSNKVSADAHDERLLPNELVEKI